MKNLIKRISPFLPRYLRTFLYTCYELFFSLQCFIKEFPYHRHFSKKVTGDKPRILFYHLSALSFGGTEKFLQIVAKHLNKEKYDVFFMYSDNKNTGRKTYIEGSNITLIPFTFDTQGTTYPFFLKNMSPTLREVVRKENIDLIITAGSGYSEHPINTVRDVPIIMINIFGSPSTQKNIVKHVCISNEVRSKVVPIVPIEKTEVMYIPSEHPPESAVITSTKLRASFGITEDDFVFGRIGRASDDIFDPIGIEAFKIVVKEFPNTHYLIQSPPPILMKKVNEEKIPHVHFLEPTSDEEKIWAFHFSIDALAHFRLDGESCGLNIIESMIVGNPIITHRSAIWNAHLEYLDPASSRVADKDNILQYASHMKEMVQRKQEINRKKISHKEFLIENNINMFENWIDKIIPRS